MPRRAAIGLAAAGTLAYLAVLVWVDSRNAVFAGWTSVAALLPVLAALSLLSYALRFARWHWLLRRAGHAVPLVHGGLAYLAGFALTATPGKLGELLRIRYLSAHVPPSTVLAAFVFERAADLVALVLLAALAVSDPALFWVLAGLVLAACASIAWFATRPHLLGAAAATLRRRGWRWAARALRILQQGLAGCRRWARAADLVVALGLGLAAWTVTAGAFAWLLVQLGIALPLPAALALYPTAMLAGAASMVPGGIGATEAAIVLLLAAHGAALAPAALAAIAIRLSGLWFAIGCGLAAAALLERRAAPAPAVRA